MHGNISEAIRADDEENDKSLKLHTVMNDLRGDLTKTGPFVNHCVCHPY